MKTLHYLMLVGLMGLAVLGCLALFMKAPDQSARGSEHAFEPHADALEIPDEALADESALAPGAAIRIAMKLMPFLQLPDYSHDWTLEKLTLRRWSFADEPKEWVYMADFCSVPFDKSDGPPVHFEMPIRFNGTVPETFISSSPRMWFLARIARYSPDE